VQYDVSKSRKPELYNLEKDLAETKELAAEEPERVAAMLMKLLNVSAPQWLRLIRWHL
jgi:hypothetical protein